MSLFPRLKARLEPLLLSDTDFVDRAFREILGRDADQGALEFYRGLLRQGVRRNAVFLAPQPRRPAARALPAHRRSLERAVHHGLRRGGARRCRLARGRDRHAGYYEKPGVWVLDVDFDKRLVAEMLSAFAPAAALELGCAAGAVLECLQDLGVDAEGVDISAMAVQRASERVRERIHQGDILSLDVPKKYDLLFGPDVFEHLNPNKLDGYLARLAGVTRADAFLFCNIPAFGEDPVFGTVFPFYVDGWKEDAAAAKPFSRLHADDEGYPIHGHLVWADAAWWTARFERAGFTRDVEIERAFHRKYDGYMEERSPARRAFFVFGKAASAAHRAGVLGRISAPSAVL